MCDTKAVAEEVTERGGESECNPQPGHKRQKVETLPHKTTSPSADQHSGQGETQYEIDQLNPPQPHIKGDASRVALTPDVETSFLEADSPVYGTDNRRFAI